VLACELFDMFSSISNMIAVDHLFCSHYFEAVSCEMTELLKMRDPHPQQQANWVY
jgi:hypothetical protein